MELFFISNTGAQEYVPAMGVTLNMTDNIVKQPFPEVHTQRSSWRFKHGLLAGTCIAAVLCGLTVAIMYVGMKKDKPEYKECTVHDVSSTWTEHVYVTETIEEYEVNGIRAIYDFERGLLTFVFQDDQVLSSSCMVTSFDLSDVVKPRDILATMSDNEIIIEEKKTSTVQFRVTDILLSEKALSLRARIACGGKDIRMLKTEDGSEHRQARHYTSNATRCVKKSEMIKEYYLPGYYKSCIWKISLETS